MRGQAVLGQLGREGNAGGADESRATALLPRIGQRYSADLPVQVRRAGTLRNGSVTQSSAAL